MPKKKPQNEVAAPRDVPLSEVATGVETLETWTAIIVEALSEPQAAGQGQGQGQGQASDPDIQQALVHLNSASDSLLEAEKKLRASTSTQPVKVKSFLQRGQSRLIAEGDC